MKSRSANILSGILLAVSLVALALTVNVVNTPLGTSSAAKGFEKEVNRRFSLLQEQMQTALDGDPSTWTDTDNLPEDMVIYRYDNDTLQCWSHQFPLTNYAVKSAVMFKVLANPQLNINPPLSEVGEDAQFRNIGPKWYLLKSMTKGNTEVIGGLEVMDNEAVGFGSPVNRHLGLPQEFSIKTLEETGGTAISVDGRPMFKVLMESPSNTLITNARLVWLFLSFLVLASLAFLLGHRRLKWYLITMAVCLAASCGVYIWGKGTANEFTLFSPAIYADGAVLYSLGAVVIIDMCITFLTAGLYIVRCDLFRRAVSKGRIRQLSIASSLCWVILSAAICVYCVYMLRSITFNSSVSLDLNRISDLSPISAIVYISLLAVLLCIPLLLDMARTGYRYVTGRSYRVFSGAFPLLYSVFVGILVTVSVYEFGFKKEEGRVNVWSNRLAIDRDITLELQLRSVEPQIANDVIIGSLAMLDNSNQMIASRLMENYLSRTSQDYDITVFVLGPGYNDPSVSEFIDSRIRRGTPLSDDSNFAYSTNTAGHARYTAMLPYFNAQYGVRYVVMSIEPHGNRQDYGYSSMLDMSAPGKVVMPERYYYAKYKNDVLVNYKGTFAYPTKLDGAIRSSLDAGQTRLVLDGCQHFLNQVSDDEVIIISRQTESAFAYFICAMFIALMVYLVQMVFAHFKGYRREDTDKVENNYFRRRISTVLMASLVLTLVVMAAVSVAFVYSRNENNRRTMMAEKISSIQSLAESRMQRVPNTDALNIQETAGLLESVSEVAQTDVTIYRTYGAVLASTAQDLYDRMIIGPRIDERAFKAIYLDHMRYYIQKERLGRSSYYAMYTPVFNDAGKMVAIIGAPFTDAENYAFETDALRHLLVIFTVFIILLLMARYLTVSVVRRMFKPLVEMGRKMESSNNGELEYIRYDRDDEIATLVKAYNRMVGDLAESTRKLAQAERDKAWSAMARQVAHEIKNPLTPMKLQIQRIIRLKERNAPDWQDKFDEVAKVVLDHIDVLSNTANEFLTFAKLYSEEPVEIDLDAMLREETSMYDYREDIEVQYVGLDSAVVTGPKPQLTRVFVNLLTNAVQAIEGTREEGDESAAVKGLIFVSLRNATEDGWYDIVFEDNGPGVSEENQPKLFNPNFTTKNGGTGIGLAICRSILEKCGATISYGRSFSLGGACFTIKYPKK